MQFWNWTTEHALQEKICDNEHAVLKLDYRASTTSKNLRWGTCNLFWVILSQTGGLGAWNRVLENDSKWVFLGHPATWIIFESCGITHAIPYANPAPMDRRGTFCAKSWSPIENYSAIWFEDKTMQKRASEKHMRKVMENGGQNRSKMHKNPERRHAQIDAKIRCRKRSRPELKNRLVRKSRSIFGWDPGEGGWQNSGILAWFQL